MTLTRTVSWLSFATLVVGCSLNPQPEPPYQETANVGGAAGSAGTAGVPNNGGNAGEGDVSHAGTGGPTFASPDGGAIPPNVGMDRGADAGTDSGSDSSPNP